MGELVKMNFKYNSFEGIEDDFNSIRDLIKEGNLKEMVIVLIDDQGNTMHRWIGTQDIFDMMGKLELLKTIKVMESTEYLKSVLPNNQAIFEDTELDEGSD